jgi:hypothetical protein
MAHTPARYILATTQELTEGNIQALYRELTPFCRGTEDILDVIRKKGAKTQSCPREPSTAPPASTSATLPSDPTPTD